ncbi:HNH endonuclease [Sphingomonas sp.]|jgi:hypothetical protein|uniref:HNH endonuclease n=1 Tax=Sphingomonas sp. TaxID=28214 RepID=UPI00262953D3|nr:hypothetical protein [Sphingomonas sp.]MDK2768012.1 hypothetical protein [Sphingomonas sp.]
MGKRFKGGTCAYCGKGGETADHVFARGLFPADKREGIPQVASCEPCNRAKSVIEHYLLTVLPFGNRHAASSSMLSDLVPGRLAKNVRLHRQLAEGRMVVRLVENGVEHSTGAVPFDGARLFAYLGFVARGLAAFHFGRIVPTHYIVNAGMVTPEQDNILCTLFVGRSRDYACGNLGEGALLYEGQQAVDDPDLTLWRFLLYNGMVFHDDNAKVPIAPDLWAVVSRTSMPGLADV